MSCVTCTELDIYIIVTFEAEDVRFEEVMLIIHAIRVLPWKLIHGLSQLIYYTAALVYTSINISSSPESCTSGQHYLLVNAGIT